MLGYGVPAVLQVMEGVGENGGSRGFQRSLAYLLLVGGGKGLYSKGHFPRVKKIYERKYSLVFWGSRWGIMEKDTKP